MAWYLYKLTSVTLSNQSSFTQHLFAPRTNLLPESGPIRLMRLGTFDSLANDASEHSRPANNTPNQNLIDSTIPRDSPQVALSTESVCNILASSLDPVLSS